MHEEIRELRELKCGDVVDVTFADLGLRIRPVLIENDVELPSRNFADDSDDTTSAVLVSVSCLF